MDDVEHVAKSEFILRLLRCVLDDDKDVVIDTTSSKSPLFPDFDDAHLRIRKVVVSKSASTDLPSPRLCVLHFCGVVVVAPVVVVVVPNMVRRERLL